MKKLPSQLSNEELLAQLAERSKDEKREITSEDFRNDVLGFSTFFKLEPGDQYISKRQLYQIYRQWSENPVSRLSFTLTLNFFIPQNQSGFFIKQKAIELSALAYRLFVVTKKPRISKSPLHQKRFHTFIETYKIKKGTTPFPLWSLHYFFCESLKKSRSPTMSYTQFFVFCKLHFVIKRGKNQHRWIYLDKSIFEVFPKRRVLSIYESKVSEIAEKTKNKKAKKQASKSRPDSQS